jgi:ketosteroid isomerase-like protein
VTADPRDLAREWARRYREAWLAGDAEAAAALYTEDCVFRSHPFRELEDARAYTRRVFGEAETLDVWFGEPVVDGDRVVAEYRAVLRERDRQLTLAGCSVMRLAPDGRCREARDCWAIEDGRHEPPPGWGL